MKDIKIVPEVRACYVGDKKAIFHGWFPFSEIVPPSPMIGGHGGGVLNFVCGLVEYNNGETDLIHARKIQFADGGAFCDIGWIPKEVLKNGSD